MSSSMKVCIGLVITVLMYTAITKASPISKRAVTTDPLLQSIHLRLDVLNKTVSSMIYVRSYCMLTKLNLKLLHVYHVVYYIVIQNHKISISVQDNEKCQESSGHKHGGIK